MSVFVPPSQGGGFVPLYGDSTIAGSLTVTKKLKTSHVIVDDGAGNLTAQSATLMACTVAGQPVLTSGGIGGPLTVNGGVLLEGAAPAPTGTPAVQIGDVGGVGKVQAVDSAGVAAALQVQYMGGSLSTLNATLDNGSGAATLTGLTVPDIQLNGSSLNSTLATITAQGNNNATAISNLVAPSPTTGGTIQYTIAHSGNVANLITGGSIGNTGSTLLANGATVTNLQVNGSGTVNNNLTVAGTIATQFLTSTGLVSPNSLAVTNNATVGGTATVTGAVTAGAVSTAGSVSAATLASTGATTANSLSVTTTAAVGGNATVTGTLGVTGVSTLSSVGVTGNATVGGTATVTGALTTGSVSTTGAVSAATLTSTGLTTANSLAVTNNAAIGGNSTVTGTLGVTGATTLNSLSVTNAASVGGNATVTGTLGVTGASTLNSLGVTNNATVGGSASVAGNLNTTGITTVTQGSTTNYLQSGVLSNVPYVQAFTGVPGGSSTPAVLQLQPAGGNVLVSQSITVNGNSTVTGASTATGGITAGGIVSTAGITCSGTLYVNGNCQLGVGGTGETVTTTSGTVLENGSGKLTTVGDIVSGGTITSNAGTIKNAGGTTFTLPATAGTLALTSQLPTVYSVAGASTTSVAASADTSCHFGYSSDYYLGTGATDVSLSGYNVTFKTVGTYIVSFDSNAVLPVVKNFGYTTSGSNLTVTGVTSCIPVLAPGTNSYNGRLSFEVVCNTAGTGTNNQIPIAVLLSVGADVTSVAGTILITRIA